MNFEDFNLTAEIVQCLKDMNIVNPTEIQALSVSKIREGRNVAMKSQTGSGKTLAYLLPLLMKMIEGEQGDQAVILTPTHELASQINAVANEICLKSGLQMKSMLLIGSTNINRQIELLKKKPSFLVGSPGRIAELISRNKIKPHKIKTVVFDEADKLLSEESLFDIRSMRKFLMRDVQMIFVSASISRETLETAALLAADVLSIESETEAVPGDTEHMFFHTEDEREKFKILRKYLNAAKPEKTLLFVNKNENAEKISERLMYHGCKASDFHSAKTKLERQKILSEFREGKISILVVSDAAARGLDITGLTHVINYDFPENAVQYLHRTGRTGRAGAGGCAVTITLRNEKKILLAISAEKKFTVVQKRIVEGSIIEEK